MVRTSRILAGLSALIVLGGYLAAAPEPRRGAPGVSRTSQALVDWIKIDNGRLIVSAEKKELLVPDGDFSNGEYTVSFRGGRLVSIRVDDRTIEIERMAARDDTKLVLYPREAWPSKVTRPMVLPDGSWTNRSKRASFVVDQESFTEVTGLDVR